MQTICRQMERTIQAQGAQYFFESGSSIHGVFQNWHQFHEKNFFRFFYSKLIRPEKRKINFGAKIQLRIICKWNLDMSMHVFVRLKLIISLSVCEKKIPSMYYLLKFFSGYFRYIYWGMEFKGLLCDRQKTGKDFVIWDNY